MKAVGDVSAFISLNGPDNVGKTTQLARLAARWDGFQMLGSIHQHDPEPWEQVAASDYASWWFERSTTAELTLMLLTSHTKRASAREQGRIGLLDRGLPMLLAGAAATCMIKDELSVRKALGTVARIAEPLGSQPETALLLLPSLDPERSYAITSAREDRPWTGVYPAYQKALHRILLHQAERGAYAAVVNCEARPADDVHAEVINSIDAAELSSTIPEGDR